MNIDQQTQIYVAAVQPYRHQWATGTHYPDWMNDGLCAQTDPELFHPDAGGSGKPAVRICQSCPVINECLAYALEHDEREGIWGGTTGNQRRKIRQQQRKAAAA